MNVQAASQQAVVIHMQLSWPAMAIQRQAPPVEQRGVGQQVCMHARTPLSALQLVATLWSHLLAMACRAYMQLRLLSSAA